MSALSEADAARTLSQDERRAEIAAKVAAAKAQQQADAERAIAEAFAAFPAVQARPGRGRCYIAERDYAAGDVVLEEDVAAVVIADEYVPQGACAYCCHVPSGDKVFASREDDYARYCSEACMRCDHEAHRHQVDATQALFESNAAGTIAGPTDSMRLALKVSRCPGGNGEWWER